MTGEVALVGALLFPLGGALGVLATGRLPNLRDSLTVVATLLTFAAVASLVPIVEAGGRPGVEVLEVAPGLAIAFEVEPLGMLFALLASGLWIVTSIYAFGYMRGHHEGHQTRFFVAFAVAITAALGVAFARNLLTLFLCYELLTLSTYPLVTHHGTEAARRAGRVYLGILISTSIGLLLFAIVWTYHLTGTLEMRLGGILGGRAEGSAVWILLLLYAFGTGKAALMPLHRWLPNAMVAPTPVSALLHAVAVVKAGVFTILKVVLYVFGFDLLGGAGASSALAVIAATTLVVASVIALSQDNLKARLAYSTIAQLAYIVLGAALAVGNAALGGGMHMVMHAVGKITLFFCAGAILVASHKTRVSELNGLGRTMPLTFGAFSLASLSVIGLPPFGGAWSKWYLAVGAIEAQQQWCVAVLMAGSLLSAGYLMPVVVRGFFLQPEGGTVAEGIREAPLLCVLPLCLTALGCLALFFLAPQIRDLLLPLLGG